MDYSLYYRNEITLDQQWEKWDLFISAFNISERLEKVYDKVDAAEKYWLIFPEYKFDQEELPINENYLALNGSNESEHIKSLLEKVNLSDYKDKRICVDITGFMRPQLLFLLFYFKHVGVKRIDFIYSEPSSYVKRENTNFSFGSVLETRQILGYSGVGESSEGRDLLIIASGYDTNLINKVAQYKENAEIVHIFGFPSLRPDMYQENILRTVAAANSFTGNSIIDPLYAPASDPFVTADVIHSYIRTNLCLQKYRHIYISPLSTKAQTLGIGLVYLNEYENSHVSLIYPYTESYAKETSLGLVKMWRYTVEF
jgi:hypothetical protein